MSFTLPFSSEYDRERKTADTYVGSIAQLMGQQGRTRADSALRSGQIWGGLAGSLGDIAGGTMQQIRKEKMEAPMRQAEIAKVKASTKASETETLLHEFNLAAAKDAKDDKDVIKTREEMGQIGRRLYELSESSPEDAAGALEQIITVVGDKDPALQSTVSRFVRLAVDDPSKARRLAHQMWTQSPSAIAASQKYQEEKSKILSVAPDASLVELGGDPLEYVASPWETGKPAEERGPRKLFTAPPRPRTPTDASIRLEVAGSPAEYIKAENARALREKSAGGAGSVSLQAKSVLAEDGSVVMANYNPKSGNYTSQEGKPLPNVREVPTYQELIDSRKFDKAMPVIEVLEDLSKKINTSEGLIAKASGYKNIAAAKLNYNNDVATYMAVAEGFVPLVARALAHTGVLTEVDLERTERLFADPTASQSLRNQKVAVLRSLLEKQIEIANRERGGRPLEKKSAGETAGSVITTPDGKRWKNVGGQMVEQK